MSPSDPREHRPPTRVRSVQRAAEVLFYVVEQPDGATATEVARALDFPTPTTFHLLGTLVDAGLLTKVERRYRLGAKVGVLAEAFYRQHEPPQYLLAPLRMLAERTGETVYLSAWRYGDVAVLASIEGTHPLRSGRPRTGFNQYTHARAAGKCLLAALDESRLEAYFDTAVLEPLTSRTITDPDVLRRELKTVEEQGYAIDDEEFYDQVACVAMPIVYRGRALAVFTVSAFADRLHAAVDDYVDVLRDAVGMALAALEGMPPTGGR